ncbi:MAG: DNA polymerase III subunit delta [Candidatus Wildermuthbacteria bacterium GWA2_46_15]|uniref:DNA polymerase III subunit delta n=1 Tax=Candidatus Wildermuthbacteria bacterium GWA2_46_15 TaxID=1802443 RepID=A0A1G2QQZ1_9BACT|nr:MAG: DNA polymerase III subunit delta [Candidatus Wildermuthbacteria bacterium GWA2_46_15]
MILFLYGQDSFRSRKKLKEIIEQHQKVRPGGLNLFYHDFLEDNFSDFRSQIENQSMFVEKKLVVIENVLDNQDLSQKFLEYLKEKEKLLRDDILIFFEVKEFNLNNSLFTFLKKIAQTQEFKPLALPALRLWIRQEAKEQGTEIEDPAIDQLIAFFNNDLWSLSSEIKKLASLKADRKIEISDIGLLSRAKIETNIFKTIDAVASGDKKNALKLINQHLEEGDSPTYLLAMVNYQFRNLLLIKDLLEKKNSLDVILKLTRLNPFVARKGYFLSQKFTFKKLKIIYSQILDTDFKIKTGKISPRQGLELMISGF